MFLHPSTAYAPPRASFRWHSGAWYGASRGHVGGGSHGADPSTRAYPSHAASTPRPYALGRGDDAGESRHSAGTTKGRPVARSSTNRRCSCVASTDCRWQQDRLTPLFYNLCLRDWMAVTANAQESSGQTNPLSPSCSPVLHTADTSSESRRALGWPFHHSPTA